MPSRFKLAEYFTVGSITIMGLVAVTLMYFHSRQSNFFESAQTEEIRLTQETQTQAISRAEEIARRNLLSSQESANANLTRLLANALWTSHFEPFLAQAQSIDVDRCRALSAEAQPACLATQGNAIRALPSLAALDTRVRAAMRGSSVFRVKLHDLRGITIYASELAQIGRDTSTSSGWIGAARHGKAVSELPARDTFRVLPVAQDTPEFIVSHLPMVAPGADRIVGVFEVHADVTGLMRQIRAASQVFQNATDDNVQRATRHAHDAREQVERSGRVQFVVVASLLAMLYVLLLAIVRRSQDAIHLQARESHAHQQRLVQTEKLATLGQMVVSVAHQLKTPLAFSKSNVFTAIRSLDSLADPIERSAYLFKREVAGDTEATVPHDLNDLHLISAIGKIPDAMQTAREMLGDVLIGLDQMSELVNHLHSFTRLDKAKTASVNLNHTLATVMYIAKSVIPGKVRLVEAFEDLPALECNGSQLNQAFLNLIVNTAQAIRGSGTVTVSTRCDREHIIVCVVDTGIGIPNHALPHIFDPYFTTQPPGEGTGLGLTIAQRIVTDHGGQIVVDTVVGVGSRFKVYLPLRAAST